MSAERAGPRRWARLVLALIVLALLALVSQLELGGLERSVNRLEASHAAPAPPGEHERGGGGGGSGGGDGVHTSAGTSQSELEAEIEAEVGPEAEAEAAGLPTGYECFKSAVRNFRVHGRKRMNAFTIVSATRCVIRVEINRKFTYVGPQGAALPLVEFDLCLAARLLEVLRARPSLFWDGGFPSNEGCDWGAVPGFDGKAHAGRYKRHATCALVGGAPGLLAADYGQSIDAHDAVVRFNDHPAGGEHTAQVGLRTTHRLTNCVYASMPVSESAALPWMRPSALNGSEIVQVCTRAHRFKLAVEQIAHDGPQHRHAISPETLCGFYEHFQTGGLTGAIGVWFVLGMCESVTLFGFSSPCDLGTPYSHYHSSDKFFELLQVNTVKVILWTHALRCAGLLHWALPHNASDACGAARSVLATDSVPPRAGGAGGPVGDAGMH
ncbi:glycosyltransferase family 29-domain-containing protein, partial [Pavlovales sp. CCMP2436]